MRTDTEANNESRSRRKRTPLKPIRSAFGGKADIRWPRKVLLYFTSNTFSCLDGPVSGAHNSVPETIATIKAMFA
jgi:hypothetical protein